MVPERVELRGIAVRTGVPRVSDPLGAANASAIGQLRVGRVLAIVEGAVRDAAPDDLLRRAAGIGDLPGVPGAKGSRGTGEGRAARSDFLSGQPRRGCARRILPRDDRDRDGRGPARYAGGPRAR